MRAEHHSAAGRREPGLLSAGADEMLGVECAFPNTEPRLAKPASPARPGLVSRAIAWLRPSARRRVSV